MLEMTHVRDDTWVDLDNGEISHTFDFNIDLDNYDIESFVPGLRQFIKREIKVTKLETTIEAHLLKYYFSRWGDKRPK